MILSNSIQIIFNFSLRLIIVFFSLNLHAIIKGNEFLNDESTKSQPYVGLTFDIKGLPLELCSATYLGNGKFLTAAHCFLLNEYETQDLKITIEDTLKLKKITLSKEDYTLNFSPVLEWGGKAPTRKTRTVIRIPKPDVVIMTIAEKFRPLFDDLSSVKVINDISLFESIEFQKELEQSANRFIIVGQGCTGYISFGETMVGQGVFRHASVNLENAISLIELQSTWNKENRNSGVCWGDSGGALMLEKNALTHELVQIGVISAMKTKHDPNTGDPAIVTSQYGRLDNPEIQNWIKQILMQN